MTPSQKRRYLAELRDQGWDSENEEQSSSEDFDFLRDQLERKKKLPKATMKLLRNVASNTYKDRKYPGRFGRQTAQPESSSNSDSDDDKNLDSGEMDLIKLTPWKRQAKNRTEGLKADALDSLKGLTVEEQLNKLNEEFNFYAVDIPKSKPKAQESLE